MENYWRWTREEIEEKSILIIEQGGSRERAYATDLFIAKTKTTSSSCLSFQEEEKRGIEGARDNERRQWSTRRQKLVAVYVWRVGPPVAVHGPTHSTVPLTTLPPHHS